MEEIKIMQPVPVFTPIQQQILQNFSSIMAIATLIGGVFVNIYILNTLRLDVDTLKRESITQSKNMAIIMDRLGIKQQSDATVTAGRLADAEGLVPQVTPEPTSKVSGESAQMQINITQTPANPTPNPTQSPTPEPTPTPGNRPSIIPTSPGEPILPTLPPLPSVVPTIRLPR